MSRINDFEKIFLEEWYLKKYEEQSVVVDNLEKNFQINENLLEEGKSLLKFKKRKTKLF